MHGIVLTLSVLVAACSASGYVKGAFIAGKGYYLGEPSSLLIFFIKHAEYVYFFYQNLPYVT